MTRDRQDRTEQLDLFVTLPSDIAARDGQDLMERPWFSLAKTKRIKPIEYEADGASVKVTANPAYGMANIWDADVLIWAVSQLVEARDRGLPTLHPFPVKPYEMLKFMGRDPGGWQREQLVEALQRLQSTTVQTNIRQGKREHSSQFSWIGDLETTKIGGRLVAVHFTLAGWLRDLALAKGSVLTIDRAYFGLSSGIDRWLYRLARKHVGHQPEWLCSFAKLRAKSGSPQQAKHFTHELHRAAERDALPGYAMTAYRGSDGGWVMRFALRQPPAALPSPGG